MVVEKKKGTAKNRSFPFEPLDDAVIVSRKAMRETAGGIVLPDSTRDKMGKFAVRAEVMAVGPGRVIMDGDRAGERLKMPVVKGDIVLIAAHAGLEMAEEIRLELGMETPAEDIRLIRVTDIVCRVMEMGE